MRNILKYILSSIIILSAVLIYTNFNKQSYEISAEQARQNVKDNKYDFIVDVRTIEEWNQGHLPNTISIPIGELVTKLPEKIPDKNAKILFVCKKGIRASGVVTIAHKLGYNNVQSMIGNYKELVQ